MTFSTIYESVQEVEAPQPAFGDFAAADSDARPAGWSIPGLLFVAMASFAVMGATQAATGAHVSVEFAKAKPALSIGPACVEAKKIASNAVDLPTLQDQIVFIRGNLGVNVSELSELLGVSRQALYSWIKGASPQGDNLARLEELFGVAKRLAMLSIERPDTVVHRPVFEGESLFGLMMARQIPSHQQLEQLSQLSIREAQQRAASSHGQPVHSFADALDTAAPLSLS